MPCKQTACLQIPMTLARDTRQPLQDGSRQPCLFQVYGAYGMKMEPEYCPATFDLLKRGWTLAFAHVRGGGELGRRWHHAGRQLGKLKAIQVDCFSPEYWCPVLRPQWRVADKCVGTGRNVPQLLLLLQARSMCVVDPTCCIFELSNAVIRQIPSLCQ